MFNEFFKGKIIVVTGAASGIGRTLCNFLRENKAIVIGIDKEKPEHNLFDFYLSDISVEENVKSIALKIKKKHKKINFLINVAGVLCKYKNYTIKKLPISEWNYVIKNNSTSLLLMIKHFSPLMKNMSPDACIVNVSSDQTFKIRKKSAPYLASKSIVNSLTKLAAMELLEDKIRVNAVAFSTVKTNFLKTLVDDENIIDTMYKTAELNMPFGIIDVKDTTAIICFLLSPLARKITGQIMLIDSGQLSV